MASTIQIKRGTGSAVPSGLADGELAINLDSGQLYFGSGSTSVNNFRFTNLTADNYTVSSSVTNYIFQTLSGSSDFGDDVGDIHNRTGSLNISGALNLNGPVNAVTVIGNISSSGDITGNSIIADYAGGTISVGKGGTGQTTLASDSVLTGNGTSGITAESNLTYDGTNLKLTADGLGAPDIIIESTADHSSAGNLIFQKLRADNTPADGGSIGTIAFNGEDTGLNTQVYGQIVGIQEETGAGTEGGKIKINVATHDGELREGLIIEDGDAEDEIDVTIGNTATSVTTIAGTLTMGSTAFVNNSGVVQVATQGTIDHDSLANFVANEHIDHSGVSITAGAGLTGGGTIAATRDIAVGAGTGVTVNANDVAIGQDVATTANVLFNNITASGNISASGDLLATDLTLGGTSRISSTAGTVQILDHLYVTSGQHITASGNISSSGNLITTTLQFTGTDTSEDATHYLEFKKPGNTVSNLTNGVTINPSSDTLVLGGTTTIAGQAGTITGLTSLTSTNITASGDISSSGTVTANTLRLSSTTDASVSSTGHAFQAGLTNSTNVIIDNNEIMARNNGAVSNLHLNPDGGIITFNNSVSDKVIIGNGNITASGDISASGAIYSNNFLSENGNIIIGHHSVDGLQIRTEDATPIVFKTNGNNIRATIAADGETTFAGVLNSTKLNTGQGDNELYAMNQDVETSDSVTFTGLTLNPTGEGQVNIISSQAVDLKIATTHASSNRDVGIELSGSGAQYSLALDRANDTFVIAPSTVGNAPGNAKLTLNATGDLSTEGTIKAGWHGSTTRIKILVSDFIPDDIGRPAMIDDTGSDRWLESHGTGKLFASIPIPTGFKATECLIYGSGTSAMTVYEADINSKTVTSKGTGNIGTAIDGGDFTHVTSDTTNYLFLELAQASGEEVYGGYVTIEAV